MGEDRVWEVQVFCRLGELGRLFFPLMENS